MLSAARAFRRPSLACSVSSLVRRIALSSRGPGLLPPCIRQRPFCIEGLRQGCSVVR